MRMAEKGRVMLEIYLVAEIRRDYARCTDAPPCVTCTDAMLVECWETGYECSDFKKYSRKKVRQKAT